MSNPNEGSGSGPTSPGCRVLLFRGRGIISALIRWQTRSVYSHAAILMPDGNIIESWQGEGVRMKKLTDWTNIDQFEVVGMSGEQWIEAIEFARGEIGRGYDYLGVIRFVSRKSLPANERWFCSELVFMALRVAGVDLLARIEPGEVSPGVLALSPLLKEVPRG